MDKINLKRKTSPTVVSIKKQHKTEFNPDSCKRKPAQRKKYQAFFSIPKDLDLINYVGRGLEGFDWILSREDMNIWKEGNDLKLCCDSFLSFFEASKKLQQALANLAVLTSCSEKRIFTQDFEEKSYRIVMIKSHKFFHHALKPTIFLLAPSLKDKEPVPKGISLKETKELLLKGLLKSKNNAGLAALKIKFGTLCFYEFPYVGDVSAQDLKTVFKSNSPEAELYTKISLIPSGENMLADLLMKKEAQPLELERKTVFIIVISRDSQFSLSYQVKLLFDQYGNVSSKEFSFAEIPLIESNILLPSSPLDIQICLTSTLMAPNKLLSSWLETFTYRGDLFVFKNTDQFFVTTVVEANLHNLFYENQMVTFGHKKIWNFDYIPLSKERFPERENSVSRSPDSCNFFIEMESERLATDFKSKQSKRLGRSASWVPNTITESSLIDELVSAAQRLTCDLAPLLASSPLDAQEVSRASLSSR